MAEESIYNLIPKEHVPPPKPPQYKSKYPADIPPTCSTFGNHTTSKPSVSNVSGEYRAPQGKHSEKANSATFGKPKGAVRKDPQTFTLKQTGNPILPEPQKFTYVSEFKKPEIPKDKPIMGLKTDKNFITSNAVEVILTAPKLPSEQNKTLKAKEPQYLKKIKNEVEAEYEELRRLQEEQKAIEEKQRYMLDTEEVKQLKEGLKKRWEQVHKEYQGITHSKFDHLGLVRKKERCETELQQLEKYMDKLDRDFVFVDTTMEQNLQ